MSKRTWQVPHTLVLVNERRVAFINFTAKQRKLIKSKLKEFENDFDNNWRTREYKLLTVEYVNSLTLDIFDKLEVPEDIEKLTMLGCYAINHKFGLLGSRIQNRLGILGIKKNTGDTHCRFQLKNEMLISSLDKYDTPTNTVEDIWAMIKTMPKFPEDLDWIGYNLDNDFYQKLFDDVRSARELVKSQLDIA
jgi:methionyl-tRNA synthetase